MSDEGILLEDAAQNNLAVQQLDHALAQLKDLANRLDLYQDAVAAIQNIHNQNSYLSEAFVRNILVDQDHHFTFIDFETDPRTVLSLAQCQTRDWLCFIFSSSYRFSVNELGQLSEIFYMHIKNYPQIYAEICKVSHKIQWLLFFKPEKLENDGKRIQKCMYFLKKLEQHDPLPMI